MGMSTFEKKPASQRRPRYQPMSEINVTPMVDVMLVLLIVFMVAAPLLTVGVPVNLPKAGAQALTGGCGWALHWSGSGLLRARGGVAMMWHGRSVWRRVKSGNVKPVAGVERKPGGPLA